MVVLAITLDDWLAGWLVYDLETKSSFKCSLLLLRSSPPSPSYNKVRSRFARPALVATQHRVRHEAPSFRFAAAASADVVDVSFTSVGHQPYLRASTF